MRGLAASCSQEICRGGSERFILRALGWEGTRADSGPRRSRSTDARRFPAKRPRSSRRAASLPGSGAHRPQARPRASAQPPAGYQQGPRLRSRRPSGGGSLLHLARQSRETAAAARSARRGGPGSGQAGAPRILFRRRGPPRQVRVTRPRVGRALGFRREEPGVTGAEGAGPSLPGRPFPAPPEPRQARERGRPRGPRPQTTAASARARAVGPTQERARGRGPGEGRGARGAGRRRRRSHAPSFGVARRWGKAGPPD